jgi:hypothetical protein
MPPRIWVIGIALTWNGDGVGRTSRSARVLQDPPLPLFSPEFMSDGVHYVAGAGFVLIGHH